MNRAIAGRKTKRHVASSVVSVCLTLGLLFASPTVTAQTCVGDDLKWTSGRYYARGDLVRYEGVWYQSRFRHLGMQPGIGATWEKLEGAPTCEKLPEKSSSETVDAPREKQADEQKKKTSEEVAESKLTSNNLPVEGEVAKEVKDVKEAKDVKEIKDVKEDREMKADRESNEDKGALAKIVDKIRTRPEESKIRCEDIKPWSPAFSYYVSDIVSYQGKYYHAVRSSNAKIPGGLRPPAAWKLLELECK